jgi:preprotein translocase subunit SecD
MPLRGCLQCRLEEDIMKQFKMVVFFLMVAVFCAGLASAMPAKKDKNKTEVIKKDGCSNIAINIDLSGLKESLAKLDNLQLDSIGLEEFGKDMEAFGANLEKSLQGLEVNLNGLESLKALENININMEGLDSIGDIISTSLQSLEHLNVLEDLDFNFDLDLDNLYLDFDVDDIDIEYHWDKESKKARKKIKKEKK